MPEPPVSARKDAFPRFVFLPIFGRRHRDYAALGFSRQFLIAFCRDLCYNIAYRCWESKSLFFFHQKICAVVAQLDRALDSDSKGQRFESPRPHQEQHLCGCCSFLLYPGSFSHNSTPSHSTQKPPRPCAQCTGSRGGKSRMFILLRYPLPERSGRSTPHSAGCCRPEGGRSPGSAGRARAGSAALPRRKGQ